MSKVEGGNPIAVLERASLLAVVLGLLFIVQPWIHFLFTAGFPVALAGVFGCSASARLGRRGGKDRT